MKLVSVGVGLQNRVVGQAPRRDGVTQGGRTRRPVFFYNRRKRDDSDGVLQLFGPRSAAEEPHTTVTVENTF